MCIIWIFYCHFAHHFNIDIYNLMYQGIPGFFLYGITGTSATALLAVISGYFSYFKGKKDRALSFVIKRYVMFVLLFFIAMIITKIFGIFRDGNDYSILRIIINSLTLNDSLYTQFWWVRSFFIGDIISYFNNKYDMKISIISVEMILFYLFDQWISICLFGNILFILINKGKIKEAIKNRKLFCIAIFIFIFILIKRDDELKITHMIYGLCSFLLLIMIECSDSIIEILNNEKVSKYGRYSMSIFLLHRTIYTLLGYKLFQIPFIPYRILYFLVFFILFLITLILAIPLENLIRKLTVVISNCIIGVIVRFLNLKKEPNK